MMGDLFAGHPDLVTDLLAGNQEVRFGSRSACDMGGVRQRWRPNLFGHRRPGAGGDHPRDRIPHQWGGTAARFGCIRISG